MPPLSSVRCSLPQPTRTCTIQFQFSLIQLYVAYICVWCVITTSNTCTSDEISNDQAWYGHTGALHFVLGTIFSKLPHGWPYLSDKCQFEQGLSQWITIHYQIYLLVEFKASHIEYLYYYNYKYCHVLYDTGYISELVDICESLSQTVPLVADEVFWWLTFVGHYSLEQWLLILWWPWLTAIDLDWPLPNSKTRY